MKKLLLFLSLLILVSSSVLASRASFNDGAIYPKSDLFSVFGNENCCLNCQPRESGYVDMGNSKQVTCSGKRSFVDIYTVKSDGTLQAYKEVSAPTTITSLFTKYYWECYYCEISGADIPLGQNALNYDGNVCKVDSDCKTADYYCDTNGYCIHKCYTDSTCNPLASEKCINSKCVYQEPQQQLPEGRCLSNSDCDSDEECKDEVCTAKGSTLPTPWFPTIYQCVSNSNCAVGQICSNNICTVDTTVMQPNQYECVSNSDCVIEVGSGNVYTCVSNKCIAHVVPLPFVCKLNSDCDKGSICDQGVCITVEDPTGDTEESSLTKFLNEYGLYVIIGLVFLVIVSFMWRKRR